MDEQFILDILNITSEGASDDDFLTQVLERICEYMSIDRVSVIECDAEASVIAIKYVFEAEPKVGSWIHAEINQDEYSEKMDCFITPQHSFSVKKYRVSFQREGEHMWTGRESYIFRLLAPMIINKVYNYLTEQELRDASDTALFVNEIIKISSQRISGYKTLNDICVSVCRRFGLDRIYVFDIHSGVQRSIYGINVSDHDSYLSYVQGKTELELPNLWASVLAKDVLVIKDIYEYDDPDRTTLDSEGYRALLLLPVYSLDYAYCHIIFADTNNSRNWSSCEVSALTQISQAISNHLIGIVANKTLLNSYNEQQGELFDLEFINAVYLTLTTEKISVSSIKHVLKKLNNYLNTNHVCIYKFEGTDPVKAVIVESFLLSRQAKKAVNYEKIKEVDCNTIESLFKEVSSRHSYFCRNTSVLSETERNFFAEAQIMSFYAIPIIIYGKVTHFVVAGTSEIVNNWSSRKIKVFETVAHILQSTIFRSGVQASIAKERFHVIADLYKQLCFAKTPNAMIDHVLGTVLTLLDLDRVVIYERGCTDEQKYIARSTYWKFKDPNDIEPVYELSAVDFIDLVTAGDIKIINYKDGQLTVGGDTHMKKLNLKTLVAAPIILFGDLQGCILFSNHVHRDLSIADMEFIAIATHIIETTLERKISEEQLFHMAYYDRLLNIPNRISCEQSVMNCFNEGRTGYLMLVDIDDFKDHNVAAGHLSGDELLKALASYLLSLLPDGARLFRYDGDEFLILFEDTSISTIEQLAVIILERCKSHWDLGNDHRFATVSIGISSFPELGVDPASALKAADVAMKHSKSQGKARYTTFEKFLGQNQQSHYQIEHSLRRSVANNFDGFEVCYQTVYNIQLEKEYACEALLRFSDKQIGRLAPDVFVPIAEQLGLISQIGIFVLRSALDACKIWRSLGYEINVNVNVSVVQFQLCDMFKIISDELARSGCDPSWLTIEITETVAMHRAEKLMVVINNLRDLGVHIALDDFGAGYFSFSTLQSFPSDYIKIDKSITRGIMTNNFSRSFIQSIITLSHSNGQDVCIEGVEDIEEAKELKRMGADYLQGYLYSKPLPLSQLLDHFAANI